MEFSRRLFLVPYMVLSARVNHMQWRTVGRGMMGGGASPPPAPCMRLVSNVRVVERSGLVVRDAYIRDKPPGCLERVR